jgi:pyrroloquinoline quinone biosynthesis protein D
VDGCDYRPSAGIVAAGSMAIMRAMGPDSRPRRREDVLAQAAGATVVLLTPDTGEYYTLNEVGGRIWELADGTRTAAEIGGVLQEEYEAPAEEIAADVLEVLGELAQEGLVTGDGG